MATILKSEFINALNKCTPAVARKELIEQSDCFLFSNGRVGGYNDEISVSYPVPLKVKCAVKHKELLDLLNRIEDAKVSLKLVNGSEMLIKGKAFESGLTVIKELTIPTDFMEIKGKFKPLPKNFLKGLKVCLFSTAKHAIFNNIHVKGVTIESCDNFRATRFTMAKSIKDELLIPSQAAQHLKNTEVTEYFKSKGWLHFRSKDGLTFSTRYPSAKYLDLKQFFSDNGKLVTLPKEVSTALNRSEVFSSDDSGLQLISLEIAGKKAVIESKNEVGWIREKVSIKNKSKLDYAFQINPKMLKEILGFTSKAHISDNTISFETKGFSHSVILYAQD